MLNKDCLFNFSDSSKKDQNWFSRANYHSLQKKYERSKLIFEGKLSLLTKELRKIKIDFRGQIITPYKRTKKDQNRFSRANYHSLQKN